MGSLRIWASHWNNTSIFLTDAALAASSAGALAEVGATALGLEGGPFGAVVGAIGGNMFHQVVTNPIESILSYGATGATLGADWFSGNTTIQVEDGVPSITMGEASATAVSTQTLGGFMSIGVVDAATDKYASAYSHGNALGVFSLAGLNGRTFNFELFSITLGR